MNDRQLEEKVRASVASQISARGYVSPVDVLIDINALTKKDYESWRRGEIDYLERVCSMNLRKLTVMMKCIRRCSLEKGLKPSITVYKTWGKGPSNTLRFSKSGDLGIERHYSTHWVDTQKVAEIKSRNMQG